ncbi:hypothetical protein OG417_25770 [Actinoallomurus sp. NBC_01490]|uniref:hypothetical protein n=1 Tax=Actinoallomurus sp. NBC_01490 TaxID=2903557 RepID=UPI002E31149F|nr:hypothetical protein [Actinoallomurus sp. NBC_01490]
MGTSATRAAIVVMVAVAASASCHGGGEKSAAPTTASPHGGRSGSASATPASASPRYTARQLAGALIKPPAGAAAISKGSGPYETVIKKLSGGAPQATGNPSCDAMGRTGIDVTGSMPSAFVSFAQVGRSPSEVLVAVPDPVAEQAVTQPVPQACRTIKARAAGTTVTATVVSDEPLHIGDGGRIIRTDQVTGGTRLRSWQVFFTGPGYLANIDVTGTNVTRADAETLARQAQRRASTTLR